MPIGCPVEFCILQSPNYKQFLVRKLISQCYDIVFELVRFDSA